MSGKKKCRGSANGQRDGSSTKCGYEQVLAPYGYSGYKASQIVKTHQDIEQSGHSWEDLKRIFLALDPPYGKAHPRFRLAQSTREHIYKRQEGRCHYCNGKLFPLSVHKKGKDGLTDIARMLKECEPGTPGDIIRQIPELDHRIPTTRGGMSALDNLCYACRVCNHEGVSELREQR